MSDKKRKKRNKASFDLYDFDHTIYRGNAMVDFYMFAIKSQPSLMRFLPLQAWHAGLFLVGLESRTTFKGNFFVFLRRIKNLDQLVTDFWATHFINIKSWYRELDHAADIIVTASPNFLIRPASHKLGVHHLIATDLDTNTGKVTGANCYGEEKLRRLQLELPGAHFNNCFSDSLSDLPLLRFADKGYIVKGDTIKPL